MSNRSQTLLDIFQEILAASSNTSEGYNQTQILSVLREQSKNGVEDLEATLVKMVKDAKKKLNVNFGACDYCSGNFWDVVEAYNSFHGYVSILVSRILLITN
ncbi:unnamed protein product [Diatraea saccharalis]|uniref:Uncharacterized protein n=1 Tax=Diatraea saccharalis TaxID=40085 RepID=A0A9N9RDT3_9NEOP|nr:unnamed protein product [Diatraea saccharalis]